MSKDDIDKAVKEAEQYAAEDKKRKEEVETRNAADSMVYQTEKTVNEMGDKMTDSEKSAINAAKDALKEALKGNDIAQIKAKQEELEKAVGAMSQRVYSEAAQAAQAQQGASGAQSADAGKADDGVVDADYREVKDDK